MKKTALGLLAFLAVCGCGRTVDDADQTASPPAENNTVAADGSATEQSPANSATSDSPSEISIPATSTDAAELLAASLDAAKASNKRVLVHLGAPG